MRAHGCLSSSPSLACLPAVSVAGWLCVGCLVGCVSGCLVGCAVESRRQFSMQQGHGRGRQPGARVATSPAGVPAPGPSRGGSNGGTEWAAGAYCGRVAGLGGGVHAARYLCVGVGGCVPASFITLLLVRQTAFTCGAPHAGLCWVSRCPPHLLTVDGPAPLAEVIMATAGGEAGGATTEAESSPQACARRARHCCMPRHLPPRL